MSKNLVAPTRFAAYGPVSAHPVQGMTVLTSLAQKVKARRQDRYSASGRGLWAPDPRVRAWPSKSRALIVLRSLPPCALSGANGAR